MRSLNLLAVGCAVVLAVAVGATAWASPGLIRNVKPLPPFISSAATAGGELADFLGLRRPKEPDKAFIGSVGSLMRRCICIGNDTRYVWDVADGLRKFAALRGEDVFKQMISSLGIPSINRHRLALRLEICRLPLTTSRNRWGP